MSLEPLFDPSAAGRPMRVACFLSGSGSNVIRIIEHQRGLADVAGRSPFEVVFLFSDRTDGKCRGEAIANRFDLPYFAYDIRGFHRARGLARSVATDEGRSARVEFDRVAARLVEAFGIDVGVLAGYMSVITLPRCVNVHPADLSLVDDRGKRRFGGDQAVRDAMAAGQLELRSSTLWADQGVDTGPLLLISQALPVELPAPLDELLADPARFDQVADQHQERLKEVGDWVIFPLTLEYIAAGRFALDEAGRMHFDGRPIPMGRRL